MAKSRAELERALAEDPFDVAARKEYARALEEAGDSPAALRQWELVCRQQPDSAAGFLGAMRCHDSLGAPERAAACLVEAQRKQDYVHEAPPAGPRPALQVLKGGGGPRQPAEVVPLSAAAVRFCVG